MRVGYGVVRRVVTRRFCCLVVIKVIEINFITFISPIHHHPSSAKSVSSYSDLGTVPYTLASLQCMAQKSLRKALLFRCFASSPGFL